MHLTFAHPLYLLALALLVPIALIERRAWSGLARWRRSTVLVCRALEVLCLVLALSGLRWERARPEVAVLFALDASRSVPESARREALEKIKTAVDSKRVEDRAGLLVFGRRALVEIPPQVRPAIESIQSNPDADYTDLAAAMRLALAVFPEGMRRRLVLFSDGNENRGETLETLRALRSAGIGVDVFPISAPPQAEVSLARVEMPGRVEREEPFQMRVEARATHGGPATLRLFRDGAPLERVEVELQPGENWYSLALVEDRPGFHTYEVTIESPADAQMDNNAAGGFTQVTGPSRALLVGDADANAGLANALALSNLPNDRATDLPTTLAGLQDYDAIVLNDVAASRFSRLQVENLETYVSELGGGLAMIGGENGFGPGGWIGTPVERALPVNMEIKTKERFPSLALVFAIDSSGSMAGWGGDASKLDLAIRATTEAVGLLGPRDLVGVVTFDSAAKVVVPIAPAERRDEINSLVRTIRPGGGTDAFAGLSRAYFDLRDSDAKLKHVLLLTDGRTRPADFQKLTDELEKANITLSTVAVGSDADLQFLEGLAQAGAGRFYHSPDPSRLPRIFVRETILVQRAYIMEETADPTRAAAHPILADRAIEALPPLHGWVVTEMKDRAEEVLRVKTDPLLAAWNYGLGKSIAYTSDARPRWGRDWTVWGGHAAFWDRAVRWVLRGAPATDLYPKVTFDRGRGRLTVEAASAGGERLNFLDLRARVIRPDLKIEEVALRQTAIGVYEAEFEADRAGAYLAGVVGDGGRQATVGGMVAFSPEYRDFEANTHLLSEIARQTGGRMEPRLEEIFRREGPPVRAAREVTAALLALAIALLLIEVAARRLYFDPEQMAAARALMARVNPWRLVFAGAGGGERGVTEALRVRSERIRQRLHRVSEPARGGEGAQGTDGTDGTDQPKSSDAGEGAASGAFASDGAASTVQSTSSTPFTESTPGASKPSLARLKKPRPTDGDLTPDAQRLREKLGPNKPNWSESSSPSAPRPTRSREPEKTTSRLIDARRKRKGDDPKDSPSTPDPDPPSPS